MKITNTVRRGLIAHLIEDKRNKCVGLNRAEVEDLSQLNQFHMCKNLPKPDIPNLSCLVLVHAKRTWSFIQPITWLESPSSKSNSYWVFLAQACLRPWQYMRFCGWICVFPTFVDFLSQLLRLQAVVSVGCWNLILVTQSTIRVPPWSTALLPSLRMAVTWSAFTWLGRNPNQVHQLSLTNKQGSKEIAARYAD